MTMLFKRAREEIVQSEKEIRNLLKSLRTAISNLEEKKQSVLQAMVLIQTFCWFWSIKSRKDWYTCCKSLFLLLDKSQIFILLQMIIKLSVLGHYFWTASQVMGFSATQSPIQSSLTLNLNLALIQVILNLRALILNMVEPFIIVWHFYHFYYAIGQWWASCLFWCSYFTIQHFTE